MMIEKSGWIEVALVEDIPQLDARVNEGGAACPVALFRAVDDHVFALLDSFTRSYAVKVEQSRVSLNLAELADAGE
ncbi:MAG: hypothetical protein MO853_08240 [Candidatus Protistobacter heckmanni]|nr:hypothetical protein [Candidatus Protistobacter heckmanni]